MSRAPAWFPTWKCCCTGSTSRFFFAHGFTISQAGIAVLTLMQGSEGNKKYNTAWMYLIARLTKHVQHESNLNERFDRQACLPLHHQGYALVQSKCPVLLVQQLFYVGNQAGALDTTINFFNNFSIELLHPFMFNDKLRCVGTVVWHFLLEVKKMAYWIKTMYRPVAGVKIDCFNNLSLKQVIWYLIQKKQRLK